LAVPFIRIIFERGAFTPENTVATAVALFWYALGLVPSAMRDLYTRMFYALQDTRTPVKVGAVCVTIHIVLNLILIRYMAHGGLALATSIATALNMVVLGWLLWQRTGGWALGNELRVLAKSVVAALVMGLVVYRVDNLLYAFWGQYGGWGELVEVAGAIGVGVVVYGFLIWLLRVEELSMLVALVREKTGRFFR
ncbi:MAG: lipid II flippase MurJ, partial [Heliobacteriaceae bacterium]|nr:lipid II flippase MurJ [Heliobacteriaceae bacterium]